MIIRAAIVLLLVLNLGVAAWWVVHEEVPPAGVPQPSGVPRLQLLDESTQVEDARASMPRTPSPTTAGPAAAATPAARCPGSVGATGSWRVFLAGLESPEAAQAMAGRIGAAGITDFLVMREDGDNRIALGLFSTLDGAQRRVDALHAAGFHARCARIAASTPA